ncbi:MAG TPA: excalibur calcium-binding domain-containing protein [Solirubrobacterales bacterium]|nr:excalibur calcium-binding domain-containing protein [Solirubrobacterales bacterium]
MKKVCAVLTLALLLTALAAIAASPSTAAARDYDCADFANQAEAEEYLLPGDPYRLDADHDGIACEDLPCPCSYSTVPSEPTTPAPPAPPPPFHLKMQVAVRISKHLVAVVVRASGRLENYELESCRRLAEPNIDCRLSAHGENSRLRVACQYKVEVRAPDGDVSGRIASHKCRTANIRT